MPNYLQNVTDTTGKSDIKMPELRIQKNDQLAIQVYSASTVPAVDALYNLPAAAVASGSDGAGAPVQGAGFLVDSKGNIQYPRLGVFHA